MIIHKKNNLIFVIFLPIILFTLTACGLVEINKQAEIIDNFGTLKGSVKNNSQSKGSIIVGIFQKNDRFLKKKTKFKVPVDGNFKLSLPPNTYIVAAFVDSNENNKYDSGEAGQFYSSSAEVKIDSKQLVELSSLVITGVPKSLPDNIKLISAEAKIVKNIGKVTTLDDPSFTSDNYSMGMWKPLDFINSVGGGVFLLEAYDKEKIPVLFIHGIGGGPTDFSDLIATLDKKHFQPIVVYYPSGFRLNMISDYLSRAMSDLQTKYGFKKLVVIAHSMGGLVSRSFLKKYFKRYPQYAKSIQLYISINSPMQGIGSLSAINYYPVVIPVWRDLVPNSDFINDLHKWQLPASVRYHMIFSFKKGEDSDGVISIYSQLPYNLQAEAVRVYGFNTNHIGPLHEEKPIAIIKSIIEMDKVNN